ncbi:MAG TPA: polyhydroxyalkanoate synthesis regulator DNA-binding domain-containing protein [Myxococcota bacterium]|nr:polyhydroxyalkanoate synthesis regulator DNA-binding domain-containing protein [Myxococcota bacterium]
MSEPKEPRVIKRYANRKLYDMSQSCYVTHDEIATLVREGEEIRIIDNRTQEDLTSATLTQILLEEEKRVKRPLPIDTLRNFFQSGGDFIQRHIKQPVATLREEAERNVRRVFGRKDERGVDLPEPALKDTPTPPATPPHPPRKLSPEAIRDALEERWLEIQQAVAQLDYPKRVADLEHRVATLEQELASLRGSQLDD